MWAKFRGNDSTSVGSSIKSRRACSPALSPRRSFYHGSCHWEIFKVSPIHLVWFPGLCIMLFFLAPRPWKIPYHKIIIQTIGYGFKIRLTILSGLQLHDLKGMAPSLAHTTSFLFILSSFPCLTVLTPCSPHTGCRVSALKTGTVSFSFFRTYSLPHSYHQRMLCI